MLKPLAVTPIKIFILIVHLNPFVPNVFFLYPLKTENRKVYLTFSRDAMGTNGLKKL